MGGGASRESSLEKEARHLRAQLKAEEEQRKQAQEQARQLQARLEEAQRELERLQQRDRPDASETAQAPATGAAGGAEAEREEAVAADGGPVRTEPAAATTPCPSNAAAPQPPALLDAMVISDPRALSQLPPVIQDLHGGMPPELAAAPMRLMLIAAVVGWGTGIKVYEDVQAEECVELPYADVSEAQWAATVVLSWRWGAPKPAAAQPGFSPMLPTQFAELVTALTRLQDAGFTYVWIDWSCVPQYSAPSMVEVLRSKVFYARARAMLVIPTFHPLPAEGIARPLLARVLTLLMEQQQQQQAADVTGRAAAGSSNPAVAENAAATAATAAAVGSMLGKGHVACREYLSRVWTLAERLARYGHAEPLRAWVSLEAWLGMLADAVMAAAGVAHACWGQQAAAGAQSTVALYRKILDLGTRLEKGAAQEGAAEEDVLGAAAAPALLDTLVPLLAAASGTGSLLGSGSQGLDVQFAALLQLGTCVWRDAQLEEAPSEAWLLGYLGDMQAGVYQAWSDADRIWAVYSYFCWKRTDIMSIEALSEAVKDLVSVAGGGAQHLAAAGAKLGLGARRVAAIADVLGLEELRRTEEKRANDLCSQLDAPAEAGNVEEVARLLAEGAKPDYDRQDATTALIRASAKGHVEVVTALLAAGANTSRKDRAGKTPLLAAAEKGHLQVIAALLAAGADKNQQGREEKTALLLAAEMGLTDVVAMLLAAGADPEVQSVNGFAALSRATEKGHAGVVAALLAGGANVNAKRSTVATTPLHTAAERGRLDIMAALLAAGADVDAKDHSGTTPLMRAVVRGKSEAVAALLAAGADKNATDQGGKGVVESAALSGNAAVLEMLLAAGADATAQDKYRDTPLHTAAAKGHVEVVKVLLAAGAPPTAQNREGVTPLMKAAEMGRGDVVSVLLAAGAKPDAVDRTGTTALTRAVKGGHTDVAEMLQSRASGSGAAQGATAGAHT